MSKLHDRLAQGPVICAEGYLFEFERRGYLQAGAFVPEVVLEHPELVAQLHREFVHAGSDVVEAFTYYAHREKLRLIGREADLEPMNRRALAIAKGVAAEAGALVAGNICNTNVYEPGDPEGHRQCRAMFDEQVGWAVMVDGVPAGMAFARDLASGEGLLDIRLARDVRGRGVGREVLRQLADHHFAEVPGLRRLEGRAHEMNVPMQRAFNAAGFRLEARYRDAAALPDGSFASLWGYALTRQDWEAGRHHVDDDGYDLHGLAFSLDGTDVGRMPKGSQSRFVQEGRRVLGVYSGGRVWQGEVAGILVGDVLTYRFVHHHGADDVVTGSGRARVQRRGDARLELIDDWETDDGRSGQHVWVERR